MVGFMGIFGKERANDRNVVKIVVMYELIDNDYK